MTVCDRGEGGVKNHQKSVTYFMDGPLDYLISQLFNYRKDSSDSIAQHVAKLESLWSELAIEHVQLPLSFLLNRILNTLPNEYFEFKSVWEAKPRDQRTVRTLTEELCLLEQRLKQCDHDVTGSASSNVALATVKHESNKVSEITHTKQKLVCSNYKSECHVT